MDKDATLQAVTDIRKLAGYTLRESADDEDTIYDDLLGDMFNKFRASQTDRAVGLVIDYLINVPIHAGRTRDRGRERPRQSVIENAIKFLMWMGDPNAIPAIERIANTERLIRVRDDFGEWDTAPNDEEREFAAYAIEVMHAIQERGYETCGKCNGSGRVRCESCDGTGEIVTIVEKKQLFRSKEERMVENCDVCAGHAKVTCERCEGIGKLLPEV